ncbi:hypothetical protein [Streptomyces sp. CFMR 7]|uniref:hypothetical protein n=1 Tax=Streptomyces sp. CFMR 7 TaxID=1649184 RepID=UPI0006AD0BAA|nr:hypothetical protein [Streptomyces sp. CFMR 7]ALC32329.1 hypothetical protein ABE83_34800 [Streptomyces sp. CFMR 7]
MVPSCGRPEDDVQATGLRVEGDDLYPPGEFGHDRREDASTGGGGGHAALGHHHPDRRAEPGRSCPSRQTTVVMRCGLLGAGGGMLVQLLHPRGQQVLGYALSLAIS